MPPIVASAGPQARHVGQKIADTIRQNNENTKPETNNTNPHPDFAPSGTSPRLSATKAQARYLSRRRPGRSGGGIAGTARHPLSNKWGPPEFKTRQMANMTNAANYAFPCLAV